METKLKEQLDRIEAYASMSAKEVYNIDEASLYIGLSKARIYTLCSKRMIPHYKQGKVYFRKSELEDWLTSHKVDTLAEIESKAIKHCLDNGIA